MNLVKMKTWRDGLYRFLRPLVRKFTDRRRVSEMGSQIKKLLPQFRLDQNSLVIDLGANRGDFSVLASRESAQIWAFEPNPYAYKYLLSRTRKHRNITIYQAAVSDFNGLVDYYNHPDAERDPLGYSIRGSIVRKNPNFKPSIEKVLCIDFHSLLRDIENISCLKIDIEGSEKHIWPSIKENYEKINFLLIEIHDLLTTPLRAEIEAFIQEKGLQGRWSTRWL